MPTYEYKCDACGNEFEKFQTMSSEPVKKCPKCGKNKVRRLISAGAGLIFKGSGFYITDYREKGYSSDKAKADSAASNEKPAESKPTESSSDSKPATGDSKPAETKAEKPAAKETPAKGESKPEPTKASKSAKKK